MNSKTLRTRLLQIVIIEISFILSFCVVELLTRKFIVADRLHIPANQAFYINENKAAASVLLRPNILPDCPSLEVTQPSLLFGNVYRTTGNCRFPGVDKNGFINRKPFPIRRQKGVFSILVLGGSVADILSRSMGNDSILEASFKSSYVGPAGEPIDVYSGAIGGWSVPNQELVLIHFIQGFDAVVALDGANELDRIHLPDGLAQQNIPNFLYDYEHSLLFGLESFTLKLLRRLGAGWPLEGSYAWAGLRSLLEIEAQRELFAIPEDKSRGAWFRQPHLKSGISTQEIVDQNIERYIQHVKNIHALCTANDIRSLHFIQPIADVGKPLTEKEKSYSGYPNKDLYRRLESETLHAVSGRKSHSLVDIFANETETIYQDRVHPAFQMPQNQSRGYSLIAEAIVAKAAKIWGLKKAMISTKR